MNPSSHDKLVKENVTKTYKKSNDKLIGELDAKSAKIAERQKLGDRIDKLATKEAFVTLKDHKLNFYDHPTCCLINPFKSEIGAISKQILDDINASIITSTKINQWKNTVSVLQWFKNLKNKSSLSFICSVICEFYPSITEKLLSEALDFASRYHQITSQERKIIYCKQNDHCCSATIVHGRRNQQTINSMSPWDHSMELTHVNWLDATFCLSSQEVWP